MRKKGRKKQRQRRWRRAGSEGQTGASVKSAFAETVRRTIARPTARFFGFCTSRPAGRAPMSPDTFPLVGSFFFVVRPCRSDFVQYAPRRRPRSRHRYRFNRKCERGKRKLANLPSFSSLPRARRKGARLLRESRATSKNHSTRNTLLLCQRRREARLERGKWGKWRGRVRGHVELARDGLRYGQYAMPGRGRAAPPPFRLAKSRAHMRHRSSSAK